ncbi:MAG: phosphatidylserine decarboxylase family protein [Ignavibacteriae bacterium]|nr:phosphatidylserine decarboxylase family protein [Ignavibacteriota bacterium]
MVLLAGILMTCAMVFVRIDVVRYTIIGIAGVFLLVVLNFFRDPERKTPSGENHVISPADGRIVFIKDVYESRYLKQDAIQVSIFMSPLDVHVNRFPVSGTVGYVEHISGVFVAAFEEKCADVNERMLIGVEHKNGSKILFKQVAGAVARRIVANVAVGQPARIGERFGMIKFGSRVDVLMPRGSQMHVGLHDRVTAGESILATLPAQT